MRILIIKSTYSNFQLNISVFTESHFFTQTRIVTKLLVRNFLHRIKKLPCFMFFMKYSKISGDGLRRSPRTSSGDQTMFEHLVRYMNPLKLVKSVFNTNRK